ncbi:GNAT family N-acetyltransferase [Pontibacter sp. SD6]|uniref:GNAT family N-acetyltransferase n=2 Tax=Pontibacter cellulosilyticus TaxID=1720253 RepID=A0A923NAQ5_9BACT|nr:GNAT family N-acetyltransferase [Pontibacter cellulosilyticus]
MQISTSIKEATTEDIPVLINLAEATWSPTYRAILSQEQIDYMFDVIYTKEALLQQMQEGQQFFIMYEGSRPVGFASYSVKYAPEKVYKLNKIYLLPECQGKGYGRYLLKAVEKKVKQAGGAILDLNVNRYNKAKDFYERCGYHVHQQEDIAIGPYWMNDFVMRKSL